MNKKILSLFMIFISLLLIHVTVSAVDNTYEVSTAEEFYNALGEIHADSNKEYIISLEEDIVLDDLPHSIDNGNKVTIIGNDHSIQLNGNKKMVVTDGAELNLSSSDNTTSLSIKGAGESVATSTSLIFVNNNAVLNMYKGVSLSDNCSGGSALTGAAVRFGTNGTFNMYGGSIHDNKCSTAEVGAAVTLDENGAVFNMYDGEISNNESIGFGGAIYVSDNGKVNITGGSIKNNKAYVGAGIELVSGSVNIANATISGNEGVNHPILGKSFGGAITCTDYNCTLNLTGCTINNNNASNGGAISNAGKTIIDNCIFEGNTGSLGGAFYNRSNECEIKNSTFNGNIATSYGGAIINLGGATIVSQNNIIKNNQAVYGGGIFNYAANDVITSENDVITLNTANSGAGVFINRGNADFSTTKIYNNKATDSANDLYISSTAIVTIIDPIQIGENVAYGDKTTNINGWYLDDENNRYSLENVTDTVAFNEITTGTEYSLTAAGKVIYTVKFNIAGENDIDDQLVIVGNKVVKPTNPIREGYVFDNWYTDDTYSTVFDFDTPITGDIVIFAKWNEKESEAATDEEKDDKDNKDDSKEETKETEAEKNETQKQASSPKTGDNGINAWVCLIVFSVFGIYFIEVIRKRIKY